MKSRLSENLKGLREKSGLKQADAAHLVGITDKNWSSYERGISEPSIATIAKIAKMFKVSTDSLILADLTLITTSWGATKIDVREPAEKYSFAPKVVTLSTEGGDNIVMVPGQVQADYLYGYEDQAFIQSLPSYRLPGISHGTFRMFELQGQSMVPTFYEKDIVVGRFVENFDDVRDDRVYVVLTKKDGILIKRAAHDTNTGGKLVLKSDNQQPGEHPLVIDRSDVLEIWYVTQYVSRHVRKPGELYTRIGDLESRLTLLENRERKRLKK